METKSLQKNKQPKKMKSAKDKHEVFVLPPDLLKKLGISIGNINVNQVNSSTPAVELPSTDNINDGCFENISDRNCSQIPSDTSILETATLMKKSVFLSPTFIPTIANGIPEEVKIASKSFVPEIVSATNLVGTEPVTSIEVLNVSNNTTDECLSGDNSDLHYDISFNGVPTSLIGNEMEIEENMNVVLDDHPPEIANSGINTLVDNQSFEINNDIELTVNSTDTDPNQLSYNHSNKEISNTSKINIISEETIPLSKLRELKSLKLCDVKNLTPITVQSIIEAKTNHEISKSEEQINIPILTVPLQNKNTKPSLDLEENVESTPTETTINKIAENTPVVIEETKKHTNNKSETNESRNNKKIRSNKNNSSIVKDDYNVSEIIKSDNLSDGPSKFETVTKLVTTEIENENIFQNCNGKTHENEDSNLDRSVKPNIVKNKELDNVGTNNIAQAVIEKKHGKEPQVMSKSKSTIKTDRKQSDTEPNDEKSEPLELASILNATKKLADNNAEIKVEKVKEIAAYLKKFSHIYTDKNKSKKAFLNVPNNKKTINSKTNTTESKLCIQGVEKPGGNKKDNEHTGECKVIKTYARQIIPKKSNKSTPKLHENVKHDVMVDQNVDAVNIVTSNKTQEFCLCYDFGRLAYYDSDNSYEHIHFKNNNNANCELATIFSIYSDEPIVNRDGSDVDKEDKTEENVDISICWNLFQNEFCENIDDSEPEPLVHDCVVDECNDASSSDIQVSPVNNTVPATNDGIVSEIQPEVHIVNNSDIILDTNDHDMVEAETKKSNSVIDVGKPLSTNVHDSSSSADSGHTSTTQGSPRSNVMPTAPQTKPGSSEISNILPQTSKHDASNMEVQKTPAQEAKVAATKPLQKNSRKRSFIGKDKGEPSSKKNIKCAICEDLFSHAEWEDHVANEHDLIAWQVGGRIYLDDRDLVRKLKEKLKAEGKLVCSLCGMTTNRFNRFNDHVKYCIKKKMSGESEKVEKPTRKSRAPLEENVTCGVCDKTMLSDRWYDHISRDHNYLAWQKGDTPLDLSNESAVWAHLQNIIRAKGTLACWKCGFNRSRAKLFLAHVKTCDGTRHLLDDSAMGANLNGPVTDDTALGQSGGKRTVNCGVCKTEVVNSAWMDHISKKHNYLAWPQGQAPMDFGDEEVVWNHLQQFVRRYGGLTCHKCGIVRKRVKLYLTHIEECDGSADNQTDMDESLNTTTQSQSTDGWYEVPVVQEERKVIKCGVCHEEVSIVDWIHHIGKEHNYLAWRDGYKQVNLDDESAVKMHLLDISRENNGLKCYKCEKKIKYPKVYLQHIKECVIGADTSCSWIEEFSQKEVKDEILTCGVCAAEVEGSEWITHIETVHQYLAWVEGQPPIDLKNQAAVHQHLYEMTKVLGGLVCQKCGLKRKYVKSYQEHVATCQGKKKFTEVSVELMSKDVIECGVCGKTMPPKEWKSHSMREHYNIAWVVGDPPIEINNPYAVESYLKEYQYTHHKLICKVCGISRVSYVGFYAHIIVCGKSEMETEIYKNTCEICNNKYLRIYKSQHMTMHKEKELALERKIQAEKERELKREEELNDDIIHTGRRKAAEKAKNVIEKYKNSLHHGTHSCAKCRFSTDVEKELLDHVCVDKWDDGSDSDVSVKLEMCSEEETDSETDTEVDSNISEEEQEAREEFAIKKKKKHSDNHAQKIIRLPYQVKNITVYMKRSTEEFKERYLTDDVLFPMWHKCLLEEVPENEIVNYMPPLEESCKVRFSDIQDWMTFKRFEARNTKDFLVMFVGASIQAISWAPPNPDTEVACGQSQFLAVAVHRGPDAPRHAWDTTPVEPGLVQIWDCGNLISSTLRFALGITHDFGTFWAIDWCPSGVRDMLEVLPNTNNMQRLGLLAAACSNGTAYIFAVPYPSTVTEKELPFYKLKPVVELRLTNGNRKVYQATAIKWSIQKGHSQVIVGYADGTTAYYDLNSDSPLLRIIENDVTIFYPYHDERAQNSPIEDVAEYPGARGAACVGSVSGAGAGALQSHVAALRVLYPPHWPAALLAGDDCLVNQSINELEWWGGGRRLGGSSRAAGCQWCGRVVSAAPPLLKLLRLHPCFPDVYKQVIGKFQMIPLGNKRKRQTDDLSLVVEPLTYSESAKKYGLQFQQITARDRSSQQKLSALPREAFPERFPLSDVAAMAFCPILKQHQKLAVAMHAGLIIIMNV